MIMKHIYILMSALLWGSLATSCLFEDEDKFDQSASLRIESYNQDLKKVLVAPEHGWNMQYFPNLESRGYNIMVSFSNNGVLNAACIFGQKNLNAYEKEVAEGAPFTSVQFTDENPANYREAESVYRLTQENGPMLALDTYNGVISAFSIPDPKDGVGYQGDDHFVVVSYSDTEILLKGARYGGRVRMVPAQGDWKEELAAIAQTNHTIFSSGIRSFYLQAGDSLLYCVQTEAGMLKIGHAMADALNYNEPFFNNALTSAQRREISGGAAFITSGNYETVSFIPSLSGIHFQVPYQKGDVEGQTLSYTADSSALVSKSGDLKLIPTLERYMAMHDDVWRFNAEGFSGSLSESYALLDSIMSAKGFSNVKIGLGRSTGATTSGDKVWGLVVSGDKKVNRKTQTTTFAVGLSINYDVMGENALTVDTLYRDKNFVSLVLEEKGTYHALYEPMMDLAAHLSGQFKLSCSNAFCPTVVTYVAKQGDFSFQVVK